MGGVKDPLSVRELTRLPFVRAATRVVLVPLEEFMGRTSAVSGDASERAAPGDPSSPLSPGGKRLRWC